MKYHYLLGLLASIPFLSIADSVSEQASQIEPKVIEWRHHFHPQIRLHQYAERELAGESDQRLRNLSEKERLRRDLYGISATKRASIFRPRENCGQQRLIAEKS